MKKLILLTILISFVSGQGVYESFHRGITGGQIEAIEILIVKVAYLETQLESAPVSSAIADIQIMIDDADNMYYKAYRVKVVAFVESMLAMAVEGDNAGAIGVIDMLILNQTKYFYKSYDRRPKTVAKFEAIKTQLGG